MPALTPVNIGQQAREFMDAAKREFRESKAVVSIPDYFLAGRAIELALKSFLLLRGFSDADLIRIRHDLDRALKKAQSAGLRDCVDLEAAHEEAVRGLNEYYVRKDLEYITTGFKSYPDHHLLLECAEAILTGIDPQLRRWRTDQLLMRTKLESE